MAEELNEMTQVIPSKVSDLSAKETAVPMRKREKKEIDRRSKIGEMKPFGEIFVDSDVINFGENIAENDVLSLFKHRGFLRNEDWSRTVNFQGKVLNIEGEYVNCECLVDKKNLYFEIRKFPKNLFEHLSDLNNKPFVFISIKYKPGSSRIDISDGTKLVNKAFFETKSILDSMDEGDDFNSPHDGPIIL